MLGALVSDRQQFFEDGWGGGSEIDRPAQTECRVERFHLGRWSVLGAEDMGNGRAMSRQSSYNWDEGVNQFDPDQQDGHPYFRDRCHRSVEIHDVEGMNNESGVQHR